MCFSATASIAAGAALSATGAVTLSKVRKRKEILFASIPLLFGIQQIIDGVVWLSFASPILNTVATYAYAVFAFALWPVYVPWAALLLETKRKRREVLEALAVVGACVGIVFAYAIIAGGVTARVLNHCVAYDTPHPHPIGILAFYLLATCGPFFVSSKKLLNVLGAVLLVSFGIAGWFYFDTFSSTWCFFSAIISGIIYWYFEQTSTVRSRRIRTRNAAA
ncbi:MAG: DUF6629 family protein [Minisyncoccia bacterium]